MPISFKQLGAKPIKFSKLFYTKYFTHVNPGTIYLKAYSGIDGEHYAVNLSNGNADIIHGDTQVLEVQAKFVYEVSRTWCPVEEIRAGDLYVPFDQKEEERLYMRIANQDKVTCFIGGEICKFTGGRRVFPVQNVCLEYKIL